MNTYSLVDPELQPLLKNYVDFKLEYSALLALREQRQAAALGAMELNDGLKLSVTEKLISGLPGEPEVRLLIIAPPADSKLRMGILHLHGGGYIFGSPEQSLSLTRSTAAEQDCVVISVDYRLAPESPFPAALSDSYAALIWMSEHAGELGISRQHIGVMGDSAGAGLAAALALYVRDRGGPALAFQNLMFPMLDDRTVLETDPNPVTGEFVWTREANNYAWNAYLTGERLPQFHTEQAWAKTESARLKHSKNAAGGENVSIYAAPSRSTELSGLPPAWLSVGTIDLFFDENMEYARRLARDGVALELNVYPGAFHGFSGSSDAEIARRARADRQRSLSSFKPR
ncbi:alpha/beta hydrolase [Rouxiella sp. WC2420]|uniref:Alpha/beta hydrolase n=1 Tax=Rouxiella sp. WC2420 TaxID=3234145 RepID=A0AB39VVP1_9GAMM